MSALGGDVRLDLVSVPDMALVVLIDKQGMARMASGAGYDSAQAAAVLRSLADAVEGVQPAQGTAAWFPPDATT